MQKTTAKGRARLRLDVQPSLSQTDRKALTAFVRDLKRSRPAYVAPGNSFVFRGSKVEFV
jgi:hypothetical protein